MGLLDIINCTPQVPPRLHDDSTATFECDYDAGPTGLYQAIENKAWVPILEFFDTGKWLGLFSSGVDPLPPERQARTWVTRFEPDGKVRWSQLPIHASLIFGAPFRVVANLVALYPQGVRCVDDQHMLPLHLAVKFGAEDNVLRLLIERFPEAICTSDTMGRLPSQVEGPRMDRTKIMNEVINVTTKRLEKKQRELQEDLTFQQKLNEDLESRHRELENRMKRLQTELVILQGERGHKMHSKTHQGEARQHHTETMRQAIHDENSREPANAFVINDESPVRDKVERARSEKVGSSYAKQTDASSETKKLRRRGFFPGFKPNESSDIPSSYVL